jgi:hypothetical protein
MAETIKLPYVSAVATNFNRIRGNQQQQQLNQL